VKPLTGKYQAIVYGGADWAAHYPGKRKIAARSSVMAHAIQQGWTLTDCRLTFPECDLWATGESGRPLDAAETIRRITGDYGRVSAWVAANPPLGNATAVKRYVTELMTLADGWPWHGPQGRADRDSLRYMHETARNLGTDLIHMSARELALATGVTCARAARSLKRLCQQHGWLELAERGGPRHAARYRITTPPKTEIGMRDNETYTASSTYRERNVCIKNAHPGHEVWTRYGKASMDLWAVLSDVPVSGRTAARRAGVAESTARKNLPALADVGLAVKTDDRKWVRGPLTPDQVTENWGWAGRNSVTCKRQLQFEQQRMVQRQNMNALERAQTASEAGPIQDHAGGPEIPPGPSWDTLGRYVA
jgi:hypothetical protein